MKTMLIIGAGGFIGGFIVEQALKRGYDTWAGVRKSTSRRFLQDPSIKFAEFDYDDSAAIEAALRESAPESGRWDCIIWNLGATKCANFQDFNRINYQYLRTFVEALQRQGMVPEKFLFMSSLSALGPVCEESGKPIDSECIPCPNTRYGLSKIKAETYLETQPDFPWIIFRPTGVYGPHEQDYLMMIKMIDGHWDIGMGYKEQTLTFIYVEDLVNAMMDAIASPSTLHKKYIISEPRAYTQKEFRDLTAKYLGKKWVIPLRLPMWVVYIASVISEKLAASRLKASTLNRDKYKIMKQRNWGCDVSDAQRDFNFSVQYPLERGLEETVKCYLAEKEAKRRK